MLPLFALGNLQLSTYSLFLSLGIAVAAYLALVQLLKIPQNSFAHAAPAIVIAIVGSLALALLFGRLVTIYRLLREGPFAPQQGLNMFGFIAGLILAIMWSSQRYHLPLGLVLDAALLPVPLGQAIMRFGCAAAGCCNGKPTDSWLGMILPDESGVWLNRYPTQFLTIGGDVLAFLGLLALERYCRGRSLPGRRWPFDGFIAAVFFGLFGLLRFLLAFMRASAVPLVGPLAEMHITGLLCIILAILIVVGNRPRLAAGAPGAVL
jgi:phosphatidylglycerol:prolipoprotein diacylglycerol transferase